MALLNTVADNSATQYVDPRARTLYGAGNKKFTDTEIKSFINTPGRSDEEIMGRALKEGISAAQISNAMKGDKRFESANVNRYLEEQGVTKDVIKPVPMPQAGAPERVAFKPITVGSNETVQGRMDGLLKDPNSTMNVQAQTFGNQQANRRGLLNSSIAVSAAQDAAYKNAMPIATQDAATFYDAKKTNSVQDLNAGMFNSAEGTRVNMFNAGNQKDMIQSRERNDLDKFIATMDSDNKLAIANIQAMANDTGIMGDLGKNLMNLYQQTAADPNISPELKSQIFNNLKSQYENITGLLPTFEKAGASLNFNSVSKPSGANDTGSTLGDSSSMGDGFGSSNNPNNVAEVAKKINVLGHQLEPSTLVQVMMYERQTGNTVDRDKVVPQQLIEDMRYGNSTPAFGEFYASSDGTTKLRHYNAYDYIKLMKETGAKSQGELFGKLFIPVYQPRTKRAEQVMFYVWNPNVDIK